MAVAVVILTMGVWWWRLIVVLVFTHGVLCGSYCCLLPATASAVVMLSPVLTYKRDTVSTVHRDRYIDVHKCVDLDT